MKVPPQSEFQKRHAATVADLRDKLMSIASTRIFSALEQARLEADTPGHFMWQPARTLATTELRVLRRAVVLMAGGAEHSACNK